MAVTSGPSISLEQHARTLAASRSAWAVSWPLLLGLAVFVFLNNPTGLPLLSDPDTHWHITVGNWILTHGSVPTTDSYSYTFPGQPWIAKEWLSQVLLALAFNIGGWGGVTALAAAAIGLTFALLPRLLMRDIRPLPALLFTAAALAMTAPHLLARPHMLVFPLILLWVAGLVRAVEQRARARLPAAAGHAAVGQHAWRLHARPGAGGSLRARCRGGRARCRRAARAVHRLGQVRRGGAARRLHHALWAGIDPGDLAHLRLRRGAARHRRMARAGFPEAAGAGAGAAGGASILPCRAG